jgi:hypothetical protein
MLQIDWIFIAFLIASMLHMVEEFFFPGGFMEIMKKMNPAFAPFVNARAAIIINGLQLLGCIAVIFVGRSNLVFSLSVASLLFLNGLMHIAGAIRLRGYAPGAISGTVLYLPLSVYAFYFFTASGELHSTDTIAAIGLGILYQLVPLCYFLLMKTFARKK